MRPYSMLGAVAAASTASEAWPRRDSSTSRLTAASMGAPLRYGLRRGRAVSEPLPFGGFAGGVGPWPCSWPADVDGRCEGWFPALPSSSNAATLTTPPTGGSLGRRRTTPKRVGRSSLSRLVVAFISAQGAAGAAEAAARAHVCAVSSAMCLLSRARRLSTGGSSVPRMGQGKDQQKL